jgi:hypothetical protein
MSKMVEQSAQKTTVYGNPQATASTDANTQDGYRLPDTATLIHATKLAIVEDKPILLDYWTPSLDKTVLIGVKEGDNPEKLLVKSEEEYTSPISKIYGAGKEYIVITENSIYLVDKGIPHQAHFIVMRFP